MIKVFKVWKFSWRGQSAYLGQILIFQAYFCIKRDKESNYKLTSICKNTSVRLVMLKNESQFTMTERKRLSAAERDFLTETRCSSTEVDGVPFSVSWWDYWDGGSQLWVVAFTAASSRGGIELSKAVYALALWALLALTVVVKNPGKNELKHGHLAPNSGQQEKLNNFSRQHHR